MWLFSISLCQPSGFKWFGMWDEFAFLIFACKKLGDFHHLSVEEHWGFNPLGVRSEAVPDISRSGCLFIAWTVK